MAAASLDLTSVGLDNEHYSSVDVCAIHHSLSEAEAALEQIRIDEAEYRRLLEKAEEEEKQVAQTISRYKVALAPHRKAPDDILRRIFAILAQRHGPVSFPLHKKVGPSPQLTISHVCARWRRISLSARELWCNVDIRGNIKDQRNRLLYQRWLARAGSHPVVLGLNLGEVNTIDAADVVRSVTFPFRVQRLHLSLSCNQLLVLRRLDDECILSDLEDLRITFTEYGESPDLGNFPRFLSRIRTMVFGVKNTSTQPPGFLLDPGTTLPWDQLCCLRLDFYTMTFQTAFQLLQKTPLLEELSLRVLNGDDVRGTETLTMSHLCVLTFISFGSGCLDNILRLFHCPGLLQLTIRSTAHWTIETYGMIKKQYNFLQLREVTFWFGYCCPLSLLLRDAPLLRVLTIPTDTIIDDEAISGIANGTLGRRLKSLRIKAKCDIGEILDMIENRQKTVTTSIRNWTGWSEEISLLNRLDLEIQRAAEDQYIGRMKTLDAAGIKVFLHLR